MSCDLIHQDIQYRKSNLVNISCNWNECTLVIQIEASNQNSFSRLKKKIYLKQKVIQAGKGETVEAMVDRKGRLGNHLVIQHEDNWITQFVETVTSGCNRETKGILVLVRDCLKCINSAKIVITGMNFDVITILIFLLCLFLLCFLISFFPLLLLSFWYWFKPITWPDQKLLR